MPILMRVDPIERDIELMLRADLSPEARSATLAAFARQTLGEAERNNAEVLGRAPAHDTFVDGRRGLAEDAVRPNGVIAYEFDLVDDMLAWIGHQLVVHSPVLTGRYAASHSLFADGIEVAAGATLATPVPAGSALPGGASEYIFVNQQPYARKIERGESPQAPDGVYEAVAVMAARRFGNLARIRFSFRAVEGGSLIGGRAGDRSTGRNPAIVISLR